MTSCVVISMPNSALCATDPETICAIAQAVVRGRGLVGRLDSSPRSGNFSAFPRVHQRGLGMFLAAGRRAAHG
jgi:hypothetical protein